MGFEPLEDDQAFEVTGGARKSFTSCEYYTVKRGDTLEKVAGKYNISMDTLYNANRDVIKDKNLIVKGMRLLIPISRK